MNPKENHPILQTSITELGLSQQFTTLCKNLNFHTLNDLLKTGTKNLKGLPEFDLRMLSEYIGFLEKHQFGHLIN